MHILLGGLPGSPIDISARVVGQRLSDRLGQPFVVDDRPGAGGNIATEQVVRAAPDGYTLLMTQASSAINTTLYSNLSFDFLRDIVPVASVIRIPLVLESNPAFPAKTVPELIAYAKAHPGAVNFGTPAIGTAPHVGSELFMMMAGVSMNVVTYKSSAPMLTDLMGGHVQIGIDAVLSSVEQIRAGNLHALAVTTAARLPELPNVATVAETVPGFLRSERLVGHLRPEEHAGRNRRQAQQRDQCSPCRPRNQGRASPTPAPCPLPARPAMRQIHRRRNRQMGQGDQVRRHQSGVSK